MTCDVAMPVRVLPATIRQKFLTREYSNRQGRLS
jgi:hypothetical protein